MAIPVYQRIGVFSSKHSTFSKLQVVLKKNRSKFKAQHFYTTLWKKLYVIVLQRKTSRLKDTSSSIEIRKKITMMIRLLALAIFLTSSTRYGQAMMKITGVSQRTGLTQAEQQAMIDEHNYLRSQTAQGLVGRHGKAADMTRMTFSQRAASDAQLQSAACGGPMHGHKTGQGQNVYIFSSPQRVLQQSFKFWFDGEQAKYSLHGGFNPGASHFSQLIWAKSTKVGCGATNCGRNVRVVCNYIPMGNWNGNPAYQEGDPCTKCPSSHPKCADFLCTSETDCNKPELKGKCEEAKVDETDGQGQSANNRPPQRSRGGPQQWQNQKAPQYGNGASKQWGNGGEPPQWGNGGGPSQWGNKGRPQQYGNRGGPQQYGNRGGPQLWGNGGPPQRWGNRGGPPTWGNKAPQQFQSRGPQQFQSRGPQQWGYRAPQQFQNRGPPRNWYSRD